MHSIWCGDLELKVGCRFAGAKGVIKNKCTLVVLMVIKSKQFNWIVLLMPHMGVTAWELKRKHCGIGIYSFDMKDVRQRYYMYSTKSLVDMT